MSGGTPTTAAGARGERPGRQSTIRRGLPRTRQVAPKCGGERDAAPGPSGTPALLLALTGCGTAGAEELQRPEVVVTRAGFRAQGISQQCSGKCQRGSRAFEPGDAPEGVLKPSPRGDAVPSRVRQPERNPRPLRSRAPDPRNRRALIQGAWPGCRRRPCREDYERMGHLARSPKTGGRIGWPPVDDCFFRAQLSSPHLTRTSRRARSRPGTAMRTK